MGVAIENKNDLYLNKPAYKTFLKRKGLKAPELWSIIQEKYGIAVSYKAIAQAINGNNSWKLLYAWAICKELGVQIDNLFDLKSVDEDERERMRQYRDEKKSVSTQRKLDDIDDELKQDGNGITWNY